MQHDYEPQIIDGRICWPGVFGYQILHGPNQGNEHPYPPTIEQTGRDPSIKSGPTGYAYQVVVHDRKVFNKLVDLGVLRWTLHIGTSSPVVDNRRAPKS